MTVNILLYIDPPPSDRPIRCNLSPTRMAAWRWWLWWWWAHKYRRDIYVERGRTCCGYGDIVNNPRSWEQHEWRPSVAAPPVGLCEVRLSRPRVATCERMPSSPESILAVGTLLIITPITKRHFCGRSNNRSSAVSEVFCFCYHSFALLWVQVLLF